ncbi:MAG: hypothetical protein C7B46_21065, partial [Sulfobacillus benefaciens]
YPATANHPCHRGFLRPGASWTVVVRGGSRHSSAGGVAIICSQNFLQKIFFALFCLRKQTFTNRCRKDGFSANSCSIPRGYVADVLPLQTFMIITSLQWHHNVV